MPHRRVRILEQVPDAFRDGLEHLRQKFEVPAEFPAHVLRAAEEASRAPRLPERDLTAFEFVSIDPPGATDLDQALFIEPRSAAGADGFTVWYAIADVAAFITAGDPVDREAHARGQTLYAPHRRTPLYPPVISENAASLLPDHVRPALVWRLPLDVHGVCAVPHVQRALIRSRRQLTYAEVQDQLDAGQAPETLELLRTVGRLREQIERDRGGVSLNAPQQEVHAADGRWELGFRSPLPVEGWNAQISLMTGMAAAHLMMYADVGVLRTLPPADNASLRRLRATARALHIPWPAEMDYPEFVRSLGSTHDRSLGSTHDRSLGSTHDRSLGSTRGDHTAMLYACTTLFRGAGYQAFNGVIPANPQHAALGIEYAHVTAPLRRLVDCYVLEICSALCADKNIPQWVLAELERLPDTMAESDRRAKGYERGIIDLAEALVLVDRIGEVFPGTVVDADPERDRGRFMITEPAVEANVQGSELPLGQEIQAELTSVDLATGVTRFVSRESGQDGTDRFHKRRKVAMARKIATNTTVARAELLDFIRPRHRMILVTRRVDGTPQLSLVTGGVDDQGRIVISTYPGRAKTRNAESDPQVSVCVISDEWNDAWVQVDGRAEVLHQPDSIKALVDYFRCISGEHPDWDDYRAAMRTQGKSLIRITPERWGPIATGGFPADIAAKLDA